jgi:hypothetical protein
MKHSVVCSLLLIAATGCGTGTGDGRESSSEAQKSARNPECMTQGGGELVTKSGDVQARDGECLTSRAIAIAPNPSGAASPEEAVRASGFGRGTLTTRQDDVPTHVDVIERDQDRVVGQYSVVQIDGEWIVDGYLTSVPNTPPGG